MTALGTRESVTNRRLAQDASFRKAVHWTLAILAVTAVILRVMGQPFWCSCGGWGLWSWDIWSEHNSQHWIDPYTFTHVLHGVLLCGLVYWLPRNVPEWGRFVASAAIEAIWEIQENTPWVIERYRSVTISQLYFGDSVANSLADILACIVGYWIAYRLRANASLVFFVALEITLAFWIRDNLVLNVLMLLFPSDAIQQWQLGGSP